MAAAKKKPVSTVSAGTNGMANPQMLQPDADTSIPRMKLGDVGFTGLKTSNGWILEEPTRAFRYPAMLKVVDEMRLCPSVAIALNAYKLLMNRVEWDVEPPVGASPEQIERANFIRSCMSDMDEDWRTSIANMFDFLEYGSHVSEKVYRRRLTKNGSKFNDGLVGLKRLAPRSRGSIFKWEFSDDGRELLGVQQTLRYMDKAYIFTGQLDPQGLISIPREKFLLITADGYLGNPEGNSILKAVYLAFKQLTLLQDQILLGVAKDVQGILKIGIPPKYLDSAGSPSDQAVFSGFQSIITNYNAGTQRGLLVPTQNDEHGTPMFTYELLESKGNSKYDTEAIMQRLEGNILDALSCGVLKLGMESVGSFSLEDTDTNILTLAVSHRLGEIASALNSDLIPQIFKLNGWNDTDLPKFIHKDTSAISPDTFSKFIQRVASVGMLPITRDTVNRILDVGGFKTEPVEKPIDLEEMAGFTSSGGKGMQTAGDGTSVDQFNGKDASSQNADNAA